MSQHNPLSAILDKQDFLFAGRGDGDGTGSARL
ncbi:Uncharacterised protein [Citrobacter koseri]|uniref:Uncharacterized protein n=1 Tax=Citrobacter koseri TaxID=545 RepID=A0A3S4ID15_CITKO|nr:Uncharacterised protein [Citrobacter koseri]